MSGSKKLKSIISTFNPPSQIWTNYKKQDTCFVTGGNVSEHQSSNNNKSNSMIILPSLNQMCNMKESSSSQYEHNSKALDIIQKLNLRDKQLPQSTQISQSNLYSGISSLKNITDLKSLSPIQNKQSRSSSQIQTIKLTTIAKKHFRFKKQNIEDLVNMQRDTEFLQLTRLTKESNVKVKPLTIRLHDIDNTIAHSLANTIMQDDIENIAISSQSKVAKLHLKLRQDRLENVGRMQNQLYLSSQLCSFILNLNRFTLDEYYKYYIQNKIHIDQEEVNKLQIDDIDQLFEQIIFNFNALKSEFKNTSRLLVSNLIRIKGMNRKIINIFFKKIKEVPDNRNLHELKAQASLFQEYFSLRKDIRKELVVVKFLLGFESKQSKTEIFIEKALLSGGNLFVNHSLKYIIPFSLIYNSPRSKPSEQVHKKLLQRGETKADIIAYFASKLQLDLDFVNKIQYFNGNLEDYLKVIFPNIKYIQQRKMNRLSNNLVKLVEQEPDTYGQSRRQIYENQVLRNHIEQVQRIIQNEEGRTSSFANQIIRSEKKLGTYKHIQKDTIFQHIEANALQDYFSMKV